MCYWATDASKSAENAVKFANLDSQAETVRNDLEFQQAIIDATGLQRTIRYFSELTADVMRFSHQLGVVYTDWKGDAERYVVKPFESLRDDDLHVANRVWQSQVREGSRALPFANFRSCI